VPRKGGVLICACVAAQRKRLLPRGKRVTAVARQANDMHEKNNGMGLKFAPLLNYTQNYV
jgi:hypothetical protein